MLKVNSLFRRTLVNSIKPGIHSWEKGNLFAMNTQSLWGQLSLLSGHSGLQSQASQIRKNLIAVSLLSLFFYLTPERSNIGNSQLGE